MRVPGDLAGKLQDFYLFPTFLLLTIHLVPTRDLLVLHLVLVDPRAIGRVLLTSPHVEVLPLQSWVTTTTGPLLLHSTRMRTEILLLVAKVVLALA